MVITELPQIGNPSLRKVAKRVVGIRSEKTQAIIADLIDTFKASSLVGMAAPQIGHSVRIFISEVRATKNRTPDMLSQLTIYINPVIIKSSRKKVTGYEGCGSVLHGDLFGPVRRPEQVTVEAYNEQGKKFSITASGLLARIIQHEYDHLDGILFTDKVTDNTEFMIGEEFRKSSK